MKKKRFFSGCGVRLSCIVRGICLLCIAFGHAVFPPTLFAADASGVRESALVESAPLSDDARSAPMRLLPAPPFVPKDSITVVKDDDDTASCFTVLDNTVLSVAELVIKADADFFYGAFIQPTDTETKPDAVVQIPSAWNTYDLSAEAQSVLKKGTGAGTYRLRIKNLKPRTEYSFFAMNLCYTAFSIYANNDLIFASGIPCADWSKTVPNQSFDYARFTSDDAGEVLLTFFVSNAVYRKGGFRKAMKLAETSLAIENRHSRIMTYSILCSILLCMVLYGFLLFLLKKDRANLYLSLFVLSLLVRIVFSIFPLIKYFFPSMPITMMYRLEYTVLFTAPAFYTLYIHALNKDVFAKIKPLYFILPAFVLLVLDFVLPFTVANRLVPLMQAYLFVMVGINVMLLGINIVRNKNMVSICAVSTFVIIGFGVATNILAINNSHFLAGESLLPLSFVVYAIAQIALLAYMQNANLEKMVSLNAYLEETNKAYYRFVPREFLDLLSKKDITELESGESRVSEMAILSCDIRNFTAISESMSEMRVFEMLNSYLKVVAPIIREHQGIIEKYLGDGIIAIFPSGAEKALLCAIRMQEKMNDLRKDFASRGLPSIHIGVGVNYGKLIIGTGGDNERMTEVSLSSAIEDAIQAEASTKRFKMPIVVTRAVLSRAKAEAKARGEGFSFSGKKLNDEQTHDLFAIYTPKTGKVL